MKSIIELAKEAGAYVYTNAMVPDSLPEISFVPLTLERFAALVRAQALEEAARVCEQLGQATNGTYERNYECAAAIRQLKEKQ